jgi:hypothetical protein
LCLLAQSGPELRGEGCPLKQERTSTFHNMAHAN